METEQEDDYLMKPLAEIVEGLMQRLEFERGERTARETSAQPRLSATSKGGGAQPRNETEKNAGAEAPASGALGECKTKAVTTNAVGSFVSRPRTQNAVRRMNRDLLMRLNADDDSTAVGGGENI